MGKYNFDEVIDRHGTDCLKYDFGMKRKPASSLGSRYGFSSAR